MFTRQPAEIGMPEKEIDTPALLLDLDPLERNLKRMAEVADRAGVRLRPHAKSHKCATIARRQMDLGAVGICCQKVSEAEAMVQGGVRDVFISYEVVGEPKLRRLAALARQARIAVNADHPDNVAAYSAAATEFGATLSVLVDLCPGGLRTGVEPGPPALDLARQIAAAPGLRFAGLQAYNGAAQHVREHAERHAVFAAYAEKVRRTKELLEDNGLPCETVSGAGTGTYLWEAESGVFNEIQPGSYVFMDVDYSLNKDENGEPWAGFEHSLFILATIMSHGGPDRAVLDAGTKAANIDTALPSVCGRPGLEYVGAGDEHGQLTVSSEAVPPRVGEKMRLIPGHCDPTVNLYDWIVGLRGGIVEAIWPISARGAVL